MTSILKQGWLRLDGDFLQPTPSDYSGQDILAYFDGRPPTWSDIVNGGLPQRGVSKALATELMNYSPKSPVGRLRLIHGASGEGKTTAAMQCAAEIARSAPDSYVLWRNPGAGLDTQLVQSLPAGRHYILFSDDAEEIARDLFEVVNKVTRPDISYVAVARTIDWAHVRGDAYPWATHIGYRKTYLTGLDEADAKLVVATWSRHGEKGLGRLAEWDHNDARVSELLKAIREEAAVEDGALLGGMIRVRYGDYFTDRVRDLMRSLAAQRTPSGSTLSSAFLYIAAAHLARLQLPPNVLAEALGVPTSRIMSEIVSPLRDEAAVTVAGGGVLTRHRLIAEACITVAEQVNANLAETYSRLVQSAFRVGRHHFIRDYEKYTNLCRFFEKSRPDVAIAAARAAVDEEKNSSATSTTSRTFFARRGRPMKRRSSRRKHPRCSLQCRTGISQIKREYFTENGRPPKASSGTRPFPYGSHRSLYRICTRATPLDRVTLKPPLQPWVEPWQRCTRRYRGMSSPRAFEPQRHWDTFSTSAELQNPSSRASGDWQMSGVFLK